MKPTTLPLQLDLTNDEVVFYNTLEINDSAVNVLGDDTLKDIAREIADNVRANATIDRTIRRKFKGKIYGNRKADINQIRLPPDKQQKAIDTVLKLSELLADY